MSNNPETVKRWRARTKERMVQSMGGSCRVCGYFKCHDALDFHHLDPTKKDLALGGMRANPASWEKIVQELRKCILLCATCHREHHAGVLDLPASPSGSWFDEYYADYKQIEKEHRELIAKERRTPCPICNKLKPYYNITCSLQCAARKSRKVDWDNIDLFELLKDNSYCAVGRMLGCSDVAVRKREKRLLIHSPVADK